MSSEMLTGIMYFSANKLSSFMLPLKSNYGTTPLAGGYLKLLFKKFFPNA